MGGDVRSDRWRCGGRACAGAQTDRAGRAEAAADRAPGQYQLGALPPGDDAAGLGGREAVPACSPLATKTSSSGRPPPARPDLAGPSPAGRSADSSPTCGKCTGASSASATKRYGACCCVAARPCTPIRLAQRPCPPPRRARRPVRGTHPYPQREGHPPGRTPAPGRGLTALRALRPSPVEGARGHS